MLVYTLTLDEYLDLLDNLGERWEVGDPTGINWEHNNPRAYPYEVTP